MPAWLLYILSFGACILGITLIGMPERLPLVRRIRRDSRLESALMFFAMFLVIAGLLGLIYVHFAQVGGAA